MVVGGIQLEGGVGGDSQQVRGVSRPETVTQEGEWQRPHEEVRVEEEQQPRKASEGGALGGGRVGNEVGEQAGRSVGHARLRSALEAEVAPWMAPEMAPGMASVPSVSTASPPPPARHESGLPTNAQSLAAEAADIASPVRRPKASYNYAMLDMATNGFHRDCTLGSGSSGSVFKGTLRCGTPVAVKRFAETLEWTYAESRAAWSSEVDILSALAHPNIVQLLGCCSDGPQLCLVYAFMEEGSLER